MKNTRRHDRGRQGVALVIVLGLLAVMTVLAVSFAIAMRIERLAARNFADAIRAEHLVHVAIGRAMDQVNFHMTNPTPRVYALWEPVTEALASDGTNKCQDLFSGEATNAIPGTLRGDAAQAAASCNWFPVTFNDGATNIRPGRIAYLVINTSGLLDANQAGGGSNRVHSVDISEIDLSDLPDIRGGNPSNFYLNRNKYVRYETVTELAELSRKDDALNLPVENFTVYSLDPGRDVFIVTNQLGEPIGLATPDVVLSNKFYINAVTNWEHRLDASGNYPPEFFTEYFDPLTSLIAQTIRLEDAGQVCVHKPDDIAWNIVNWIDKDRHPQGRSTLLPYLHTEGGEAMPYVNEIMLKPLTNGSGTNCKFTVEVWWPFFPQEANALCQDQMYFLEIQTCPTDVADGTNPDLGPPKLLPPTTTTHEIGQMVFGSDSEFKVFDSGDIQGTCAWIRTYMYYRDPVLGPTIVDGALNRRPTGGYPSEELVFVKFTNSTELSRQVCDPRSNGKINYSGGRCWYWKFGRQTLDAINHRWEWDFTTSADSTRSLCDPWWWPGLTGEGFPLRQGLPIHVRNGPMVNIGELGYVSLSNRENAFFDKNGPTQRNAYPEWKWFWSTIDLYAYNDGAYLLDHATVRPTNSPTYGLVSLSTRQDQVLRALYHEMPLGDLPGNRDIVAVQEDVDASINAIVDQTKNRPFFSFQDMFDTRHGRQGVLIGNAFKEIGKQAWKKAGRTEWNDKALEDPLRNILDLISFRHNLYTLIVAAQAFGPDGNTVVAEKRAIALVYRDAYTGSYFTRSFKWLTD